MVLGWTIILPLSLAFLFLTSTLLWLYVHFFDPSLFSPDITCLDYNKYVGNYKFRKYSSLFYYLLCHMLILINLKALNNYDI